MVYFHLIEMKVFPNFLGFTSTLFSGEGLGKEK